MRVSKQVKMARIGYILVSILLYISGIVCIVLPGIDVRVAAIVAGMVLLDGLLCVQTSIDAKKFGISS